MDLGQPNEGFTGLACVALASFFARKAFLRPDFVWRVEGCYGH